MDLFKNLMNFDPIKLLCFAGKLLEVSAVSFYLKAKIYKINSKKILTCPQIVKRL